MEQGDQGNARNSQVSNDFGFPVRIVQGSEEENRSRQREDDAEVRERRDLAAQESMAESTALAVTISWWQLWLSAIGTVVAAVGTGGLIYSLILNKRATKAAVAAADAAKEAIGIERAWISSDGMTRAFLHNANFDGEVDAKAFGIMLNWRNDGRSPALRLNVYSDHALVDVGARIPTFGPAGAPDETTAATVGPNATFQSALRAVRQADYILLQKRELLLYVYGRATYEDIYSPGLIRVTEFCAMVEFNGETITDDGIKMPNTGLRPVGPQNSAN